MELTLNRAQYIALKELDTKYFAYVGGMGSGKTFTACLFLLMMHAKYPGTITGFFGVSHPSIREVFFPGIEEAAELLGFEVEIYTSVKEVHIYRNGQFYGKVICRSMDKPYSIVGYKISFAVVDELDTIDNATKAADVWRRIDRRCRLQLPDNAQNRVLVTTTPEGYGFVYEQFYNAPSELYSMVQASALENAEHLPDDYMDVMDDYPEQLRDAYLHGRFVNMTSGTVFRSYNPEVHDSKETVQGNETLRVGIDFNIDKMCAVVFVVRPPREGRTKPEWHAVDEINYGYNTEYVCKTIKERYPSNAIIAYPDSTGQGRTTAAMEGMTESDHAVLRQYKFKIKAHAANPRHKDSIAAVNGAFENGRLFVNKDKCPDLKKCLVQLSYDKNGQMDRKSDKDHKPDSFRYPITFEMPVHKPVTKLKMTMGA